MNYVKRHACQIVKTSTTRRLPTPMTNYFELLSHSKSTRNNKCSIALRRVRTKAAYKWILSSRHSDLQFLTRDIRMQENENLILKRLRNFNF